MRRRDFVGLVGGAAAWPLAARAQQPARVGTIAYLGPTTFVVESLRLASLVQRSTRRAPVDGRNIAIEVRWADGRDERLVEIAAELVRLRVDVIVTYGTPPIAAAQHATSSIPIVIAVAGDPIGSKLVGSLARPGGQVDLASVPLLRALVATPADRQLIDLLSIAQEMGRPFVMPPDTPKDMLTAIRRGFDATLQDPLFLADAEMVVATGSRESVPLEPVHCCSRSTRSPARRWRSCSSVPTRHRRPSFRRLPNTAERRGDDERCGRGVVCSRAPRPNVEWRGLTC
jgi:hypothetical protein